MAATGQPRHELLLAGPADVPVLLAEADNVHDVSNHNDSSPTEHHAGGLEKIPAGQSAGQRRKTLWREKAGSPPPNYRTDRPIRNNDAAPNPAKRRAVL
jgi:hypothetical protein